MSLTIIFIGKKKLKTNQKCQIFMLIDNKSKYFENLHHTQKMFNIFW